MDSIILQEHLKDDIKRVSKSGDVNLLVLLGKLKEELKTDDAMFCNSCLGKEENTTFLLKT